VIANVYVGNSKRTAGSGRGDFMENL
jgi:hypothetical protein